MQYMNLLQTTRDIPAHFYTPQLLGRVAPLQKN